MFMKRISMEIYTWNCISKGLIYLLFMYMLCVFPPHHTLLSLDLIELKTNLICLHLIRGYVYIETCNKSSTKAVERKKTEEIVIFNIISNDVRLSNHHFVYSNSFVEIVVNRLLSNRSEALEKNWQKIRVLKAKITI